MYHLGLVDRVDLLLPTSYIGGVTRNGEHRMTIVQVQWIVNENVAQCRFALSVIFLSRVHIETLVIPAQPNSISEERHNIRGSMPATNAHIQIQKKEELGNMSGDRPVDAVSSHRM